MGRAYQKLLLPSFLPALAVFMTVLVAVSMIRRKTSTSTTSTVSRILIGGPCLVILWLGGFYALRSLIERHAYEQFALVGIFVVVLVLWVFWPDESDD